MGSGGQFGMVARLGTRQTPAWASSYHLAALPSDELDLTAIRFNAVLSRHPFGPRYRYPRLQHRRQARLVFPDLVEQDGLADAKQAQDQE